MPYVYGMWALGALTVLVCAPLAWRDHPSTLHLLAAFLLCALADLPLVERRTGYNKEAFTFAEACLLVAFVLVPGPALVIVCALAVLAFNVVCRIAPVKAAFNALSAAVGTAIAGAVLAAFTSTSSAGIQLTDMVGLVAATVAFHVWNSAAISGAMARAQSTSFMSIYREGAMMRSIVGAGNIVVGLFIVVVGDVDPTALFMMPPMVLALYFLYRGYLRANQERDVWQQLEVATRELNLLERDDIVAAALRRAQQLFRTDAVEMVVGGGDSCAVFALDAQGDIVATEASADHLLRTRSATYVEMADADDSAVTTCLVAPLDGPKGRVGLLRLIFGGPVKLSARERQVLSTFAHAVATTLINAELYSDVRAEAARQAYEASHDHLTGLGNRALLSARKQLAVDAGDGTTALLLLDLDHFKEINDTLGHAAGDVLLQTIGSRLARLGRDDRFVARLGGDEFAILLTGLSSPEQAEPVADTVLRLLAEPVEYEGLRLSVECSLGIACHPQDATAADELFRRADVAMYQAKSSRGSWLRYSAERDDSSVHRQALVAELRSAIDAGDLVVHYQPQVDLATGDVVGAEALCRWQHHTRGLLPPGEFVSAAEHSGLVRPFTLYVLDRAIAECVSWQSAGRPLSLAVNLSARSLLDRQLPDDVRKLLDRHGLPPQRLVLEITETTATSELEVVEDVLSRLRRLGVELSVDDFGTGYSSLAFLQRTAVNELKVDRSFVSGMLDSENDMALVRATVQLARSLGARSVAEGVEDRALAEALRDMGCDVAQGYWYSRPVPATALRELLLAPPATTGSPGLVPAPRPESDGRHLQAVAEPA